MKKLLLIPMLALAACATNPNKVSDLNTTVERITVISGDTVVGVKDGSAIYQKKLLIGEELRSLQNKTYEAEAHLYGGPRYYDNNGMIGALKSCRSKVSALSDGKLQWTEKRDYIIPEDDFKLGIDESGKLSAVTEEGLKTRIERFRQYKQALEVRTEEMEDKIKVCDTELAFKAKHQEVAAQDE